MAQKRMFDKRITDSDRFTDLPNSSKALYFMAGMNADDRGFFQPRRLQKMSGFTDDDFKVLIAKRYFPSFNFTFNRLYNNYMLFVRIDNRIF